MSAGVEDRPLVIDTAVSEPTASAQGIAWPIACTAYILVVPVLETGTLLARQRTCAIAVLPARQTRVAPGLPR